MGQGECNGRYEKERDAFVSSTQLDGMRSDQQSEEAMMRPKTTVSRGQRQATKREIIRQVEQGIPVSDARSLSPVPMHRTTVYRLLKRAQYEGEQAFIDGRHGHPVKLRGEILAFLLDFCQSHPSASSTEVQRLLVERFSLSVSVSQLNRVRATHGLSRMPVPREKKPKTSFTITSGSHEQAGGLLLLAAATETGLLSHLEQALPPPPDPPCLPLVRSPAVRSRLLLTMLSLGAVGLRRTWDLRGYTADGLALLTGRTRAYGYRYTEAFVSQVARADGADRLTDALASWTTHLWHTPPEGTELPQTSTYYVDRHRKAVYSDVLIPRGLIGRLPVVCGLEKGGDRLRKKREGTHDQSPSHRQSPSTLRGVL